MLWAIFPQSTLFITQLKALCELIHMSLLSQNQGLCELIQTVCADLPEVKGVFEPIVFSPCTVMVDDLLHCYSNQKLSAMWELLLHSLSRNLMGGLRHFDLPPGFCLPHIHMPK